MKKQWYTLRGENGLKENSDGTKYGDVKLRVYLDFEYFYHPAGSMFTKEIGRLEVFYLYGVSAQKAHSRRGTSGLHMINVEFSNIHACTCACIHCGSGAHP